MPEFESQTVTQNHDISLVYNNQAGDKVIEVLQNNPQIIRNVYGLEGVKGCANAILREIRCYASINSLKEAALPEITGEDTESQKLTKVQSFEWKTDRFELIVYRRAAKSSEWIECGVTALKNSQGFRYRTHRILDMITDDIGALIGEWGRIGIAIKGVGYGLPQTWDRITITGNWVQEFTWCQSRPTYVQINNYGASPSPSPTPTPTPTPTLTLSITGTSAIANNDEKITLAITDIPVSTQLSGTWFKNGVDTGATETITVTGQPLLLSTLKLREKLSGNYSLRLFYNGNGYLSNAVAVTVNPEIEISPTTADTVNTPNLTITGRYFTAATISYTYNWLRAGTVVFTSSGGAQTLTVTNNSWVLTLPTSQLQNSTSGDHTFRANIVENNVSVPYSSKNAVAITVSNPPTISLSPTSANVANAEQNFSVTLQAFTSGESLTTTWQREGVDVSNTTETRTYTPTNNQMIFSKPRSYFYVNGAYGNYRVKVTRSNGTIFYSNTTNLFFQQTIPEG